LSDIGTDVTFLSASSAVIAGQQRDGGGVDGHRPPALKLQKSDEQIALSPLMATPEPVRSPGSQPKNRCGALASHGCFLHIFLTFPFWDLAMMWPLHASATAPSRRAAQL
jgi:hypothetical protein